jgi:hypothetical protein
MRRAALVVLFSLSALAGVAAPPDGRWTGHAQLPGRVLPLVVDLARDASGAWSGSLTIPGLDIKGAGLGHVAVEGNEVAFDAGNAIGVASAGGATFKARIDGSTMAGEMRQAGNAAPFTLRRTGDAQVDAAARSTPVAASTEGRWIGRYEMAGYPRQVTLDIANDGTGMPKVDFVVVGKLTTKLPIDFVAEEEGILRIESHPYGITLEARVAKDRIEGTLEQGAVEVPILLRRSTEKAS